MSKKYYYIGVILLSFIFAFRLPAMKYPSKNLEATSHFIFADSTPEQIFLSNCYNCHRDSGASMAPGISILSTMSPRAILASMNNGKMRQQAANLSEQERKEVAEWVTKRK